LVVHLRRFAIAH